MCARRVRFQRANVLSIVQCGEKDYKAPVRSTVNFRAGQSAPNNASMHVMLHSHTSLANAVRVPRSTFLPSEHPQPQWLTPWTLTPLRRRNLEQSRQSPRRTLRMAANPGSKSRKYVPPTQSPEPISSNFVQWNAVALWAWGMSAYS